MLKKFALISLVLALSACVSEPVDPAFIGTGAIDRAEAAKTRVSLGLTYLKNGNYSQAKSNLDKALEFAPRSGEAHYAMAYYFQQVGEANIAEEYYENALGYSRNDPDIVNSYGAFLCEQGRYEKAKTYFLEAVNSRSYSATAETYENLAICSQNQGETDAAIEYFNNALNHQPTRARSLFLLANLYAEKQQWQEAKRALWKFERNSQVSAESLFLNYRIASGLNDLKAAVGYGDLLKQMYPDHPHTKSYLAQMGKFQPAARITRKLPAVDNSSTEIDSSPALVETSEEASTSPEDNKASESEPTSTQSEAESPTETQGTQTLENDTSSTVQNEAESLASENESNVQTPVENETVTEPSKEETKQVEEESAESAENEVLYHIVQPKENLYRISLKYNVKMQMLLDWNNIDNASDIKIGTKLRVKEPE